VIREAANRLLDALTNGLVDSRVQHSAFITEEMGLRDALAAAPPLPSKRPSDDLTHQSASVLGVKVATDDGDFKDLAYCDSPLGRVSFTRARMDRWEWYLETIHREADDFDTISCSGQFHGLEAAASDCDKQLRALVKKAQALP